MKSVMKKLIVLLGTTTAASVFAGWPLPGVDEDELHDEVIAYEQSAHYNDGTTCLNRPVTIFSDSHGATVRGTSGNDVIFVRGTAPVVYAGNGDDLICVDGGAAGSYGPVNATYGEGGTDIIYMAGYGSYGVYGGDGDDYIIANQSDPYQQSIDITGRGDAGNDHLWSYPFGTSIVTFNGGPGVDSLWGGPYTDYLTGGSGNDDIRGGDGYDYIYGGEGIDTLHGDAGDDIMYGDCTVYDPISECDPARSGADRMFGDDGKDSMYGGPGNDYLKGGAGTDVLKGEAGNDTEIQ
jgi:Ca2+-binding RTX toxin-like protein